MRPRGFRISERAADDLTTIYDHIAKENPRAARHVIESIEAKIKSIAALGLTGSPRGHLRSGLRMVVSRNFLIYFRALPSHLLIIRILHGRQDISSQDFPESET